MLVDLAFILFAFSQKFIYNRFINLRGESYERVAS
ncbi:hypothetical protein vBSenI1_07 [Salmonella phage vB_Sen_I1]|uniref:Uncharacterized protein n=1 Tax=Salmonella phage vB_Sen_I1 TaxID=2723910 RepID=A0A7L5CE01_9CAUD|nr:hypothetical protein vBSenI1_07 [Salmonella phage vB_Sen_I1]